MSDIQYAVETILHDAKMLSLSTLSFAAGVPYMCVSFTPVWRDDLPVAVKTVFGQLPSNVTFWELNGSYVFDLVNSAERKITGCCVYLYRTDLSV